MKELEASVKERETLHTLVSSLYDVQHIRIILSNRFESKLHQYEYGGYVDDLLKVENNIKRDMKARAKKKPITTWIVAQRGLGYDLASQLIGIIQGPEAFDNISRLWSYFGLAVVDWCAECNRPWYEPRRKAQKLETIARRLKDANDRKVVKEKKDFEVIARKMVCNCEAPKLKKTTQKHHEGVLGDYNPEAKTLAFKIGVQFVKQGAYYRELYDKYRAEYESRDDLKAEIEKKKGKRSKGKGANGETTEVQTKGTMHIHLMAQRKTVKDFLSDLWVVWRQLEGLPRTDPWIIAQGGHAKVRLPPPPEVRVKDGQPYLAPLPTEIESAGVSSGSHASVETRNADANQNVSEPHGVGASQWEDETHSCFASQVKGETHCPSASHGPNETQKWTASQKEREPQRAIASHRRNETQPISASHVDNEPHQSDASQKKVETHIAHASQRLHETHAPLASQCTVEIQFLNASQRQGETQIVHASQPHPETQDASASHLRDETQPVIASQAPNETHCLSASQRCHETQMDHASHTESHGIVASQEYDETQIVHVSQRRRETPQLNASHSSLETHGNHANTESAKDSPSLAPLSNSRSKELIDFSRGD